MAQSGLDTTHISDACVNCIPLSTFKTNNANSYDTSIEKSSLGLSPAIIFCTKLKKKNVIHTHYRSRYMQLETLCKLLL